jgi:hypothetical protein
MVTDLFGSLLQELSASLDIPALHPDSNNSCLIKFKSGVAIQIEVDRSGHHLVIGSDLGSVPIGKYRENLFREALKCNELPPPLHGILSYSEKTDHLVIYEKLPLQDLNGEKIAAAITPFTEKALIWAEALKHNDIPAINQMSTSQGAGGMFGMRP